MLKILAIIVLYFPEQTNLERLIHTLLDQGTHEIMLVDNASIDGAFLESLPEQVSYYAFSANRGVATAQNYGLNRALQANYDFAILFDQDSSIPNHLITNLLKAYQELAVKGYQVAAVGPSFCDPRFKSIKRCQKGVVKRHTPMTMLISSGCLIPVSALKAVGLMRDWLFIDFIDTEWCYRAKQQGYQVFKISTVTMHHTIGSVKPILRGHYLLQYAAPIRYYYFTRNLTILSKKGLLARSTMLSGFLKHLPILTLKIFFLPRRQLYFSKLIMGLKDGLTYKE